MLTANCLLCQQWHVRKCSREG